MNRNGCSGKTLKLWPILVDHFNLGARGFDSIGGEVVSTTAFVLGKPHHPLYQGAYFRLVDGNSEAEKAAMFKEALA